MLLGGQVLLDMSLRATISKVHSDYILTFSNSDPLLFRWGASLRQYNWSLWWSRWQPPFVQTRTGADILQCLSSPFWRRHRRSKDNGKYLHLESRKDISVSIYWHVSTLVDPASDEFPWSSYQLFDKFGQESRRSNLGCRPVFLSGLGWTAHDFHAFADYSYHSPRCVCQRYLCHILVASSYWFDLAKISLVNDIFSAGQPYPFNIYW